MVSRTYSTTFSATSTSFGNPVYETTSYSDEPSQHRSARLRGSAGGTRMSTAMPATPRMSTVPLPPTYVELPLSGTDERGFQIRCRSWEAVQCLADPATNPPLRVISLIEDFSDSVLDVRRKDGGCVTCQDVLVHISAWCRKRSKRYTVYSSDHSQDALYDTRTSEECVISGIEGRPKEYRVLEN
ncbi:hypothetical protein SISSUDRAFT_1034846 [Sistotremastrum suecicum HHB10207 ss-3]|uniref:DUF6699 domain-containing protein n=1 Tax=Sistotremastrum suecicum HHB10207 ss-3 TaxID=1314776 RepID=A0A166BJD2_9AGAM|nr:hypothetical protein SISSUDRAFT_1034846 [Sistotremastrum suecicum HHB10207 ss-3]